MIQIIITEKVETIEDACRLLFHIHNKVAQGHKSGTDPAWYVDDDGEPPSWHKFEIDPK